MDSINMGSMGSNNIAIYIFIFLIAGWIAHLIQKSSNDNAEKITLELERIRKLLEKPHEP